MAKRRKSSGLYRPKKSRFWHYDFWLSGDRFRGSTKAETREAAELIVAKIRHDALVGAVTGKRPSLTLDAALARYWLDHAAALPSAATTQYQGANLVRLLGANTLLEDMDDARIADFVSRRRGEAHKPTKPVKGKERRLISPASVNRELGLLRRVMRRADRAWKVAVATPDWSAHWLAEPELRDRYLTVEEAQRVIDEAAPHLKDPIRFSLYTGVRLDNAMKLDWRQIDMRARTITFRVKSRKPGRKPHVVPIADPVLVLLANLGPQDAGRVFLRDGQPIRSWRTAWEAALRRAGIEDFRWHDLRHTCATWLVDHGVALDVVQKILGHATIATTLRYVHRKQDAQRAALALLPSLNAPQTDVKSPNRRPAVSDSRGRSTA